MDWYDVADHDWLSTAFGDVDADNYYHAGSVDSGWPLLAGLRGVDWSAPLADSTALDPLADVGSLPEIGELAGGLKHDIEPAQGADTLRVAPPR